MHWLADLMAAIGVVLNGIPQGIMAMTLGFAIFPTSFSFVFGALVNGAVGSVAPISFQAESLGFLSRLGQTHRERSSIIFGGSIIMLVIGLTGTLTSIVHVLGNGIIAGMMAGVGLMLSKISLTMVKNERIAGGTSVGVAVLTYLLTKDLVWTIVLSVIASSVVAVYGTHYRVELPQYVVERRFHFLKPMVNLRVIRGALSLACLNIGANISYGLVTGQLTGIKPNPVNLNILTGTQAFADMGTSLLGGAPVESIISATASAPEPVVSGILMMLLMALLLFSGWLPRLGKYVPAASIAGFLLILGAVIIFPENAALALKGSGASISALTLIVTALVDPMSGLLTGAIFKFILPIIGLGL